MSPPISLHRSLLLLVLLPILCLHQASASDAATVRVAVLKFGTVNWEMSHIQREGLDQKEGFELEVIELAGKQATMVALQSGDVDIALIARIVPLPVASGSWDSPVQAASSRTARLHDKGRVGLIRLFRVRYCYATSAPRPSFAPGTQSCSSNP